MSLLDDVSIVVTPNGYKAGELYGVIPVPTEGSEEVTNGDFATDSDWNLGSSWDISGGKANYDAVSTGQELRQLMSSINVGQLVNIVFEVSDIEDGKDAYFKLDCSGAPESVFTYTKFSAGTYTYAHAVTSGFNRLTFTALNSSTGGYFSIDNVSVKEYTSADMDVTRATAGTRVDENGLVNYAEVLGSEEVTNGDFSSGTTGWTEIGDFAISGGKASITSASQYSQLTSQQGTNFLTSGKQYKLQVDIETLSISGVFAYRVTGGAVTPILTSDLVGGVYTTYFTMISDGYIWFQTTGSYTGLNVTIDNVSVKEVTRDNVPRIDYTGGGCPHILAEPQSINLYTNYNLLTAINSGLVSLNNSISPDGTNNATKLTFGSTTNDGAVLSIGGSACVASTLYTFSFYAKSIVGDGQFNLRVDTNSQSILVDQNFTTTTDWVRYIHTFTSDASATSFGSNSRFRKVTASNEILFYGMQLEKLSYSTSIIPTSGSTVTRNQDIFTRDGIGSLINSTEGVLFSEVYFEQTGSTNGLFAISDGTFNNILMVRYSPINKLQIESTGGVNLIESSARPSGTYKIAVKYDSNGVELWVDGNKILETSTQSTMSGINELMLGKSPYGNIVGCKVKQLQVYDTALTDEQLLQLTGTSGTDFYESYAEMASALTYTIQ